MAAFHTTCPREPSRNQRGWEVGVKGDALRQWTNVLAVILLLVVNGLANALPLNGQTTAAISDRFKVYFVPAGYVFSIWGLIYIALIAFAVYQALPAQREDPRLRRTGYWFALSCVANSVWIFFWHYELFLLTLVAMLTLLTCLIVIYLRLGIGCIPVSGAAKWCVNIPFSIYLGWITVATIANVADVLYYLQWDGWGQSPETWMGITLVVATAIASAVSLTRGDVAYMLVIVWAFIGISVKEAGTPVVATMTNLVTAVVVVMLVVGALANRRRLSVTAAETRPD
jgi:hypothetical protein